MLIRNHRYLCFLMLVCYGVFFVFSNFSYARGNDFEKLRQESAKIKTLKADFVQKKFMKILAGPLVSEGCFYYAAPDSFRWEYLKPLKSIALADKNNTRRYIYSGGKMVEDKTGGAQAMKIVLNEVAGWMSGRFDQNPSFKATISKQTNTLITLTPVEESMKAMIEKIEITLAPKAGIVKSVKISEGVGNSTQIDFKNVKTNEMIDASVFREVR